MAYVSGAGVAGLSNVFFPSICWARDIDAFIT